MILVDKVFREPHGGWTWLRLFIEISMRRGIFESGTGWSYAGVIHRKARRIGPVNVAVLRLIGDNDEPYRGQR